MYLGRKKLIKENIAMAEQYADIARQDEMAAVCLEKSGLFNQAGYLYMQAMEKQIKAHIAGKINIMLPHFAEELRKTLGHSLEESINLLLKVYAADNKALNEQMKEQLLHQILKDTKFQRLNSSLRYPMYNESHSNYSWIELEESDCRNLSQMLAALKKYLDDLSKI